MTKSKKWIAFRIIAALLVVAATAHFMGTERTNQKPICNPQDASVFEQCLIANAATVDYTRLGTTATRVLVFGEAHASIGQKDELSGHFKELAQLGFTAFAIEAMPSSKQHLIDDYQSGKLSRQGLGEEIQKSWGYNPEPYLRAIDAAQQAGMATIFLDRDQEHVDLSLPNWAELERAVDQRREAHWVDLMQAASKNGKIVALVGNAHVRSIQGQLTAVKLDNKAIALEGGEFFYDTPVTYAARHAGLQAKRLIVRTGADEYSLLVPQADHAVIISRIK